MLLPGSDDFGSRWEDMTDQGENKEPDMNPDSDQDNVVLTKNQPVLTRNNDFVRCMQKKKSPANP